MSQNDVNEPVATCDHANDLILYENDSRNGSGSSDGQEIA